MFPPSMLLFSSWYIHSIYWWNGCPEFEFWAPGISLDFFRNKDTYFMLHKWPFLNIRTRQVLKYFARLCHQEFFSSFLH